MAHYISYSLFDGLTTWITVVILELIHAQIPVRDVFIRLKPMRVPRYLVIHNNFRIDFGRCIIQVSALSALDGRVLAYHGFNG